MVESVKGGSALTVKEGEKAGWLSGWLSSLDWSTVRYLMFGISFAVVGIYQYSKFRSNKAAKESARKNTMQSQQARGPP